MLDVCTPKVHMLLNITIENYNNYSSIFNQKSV